MNTPIETVSSRSVQLRFSLPDIVMSGQNADAVTRSTQLDLHVDIYEKNHKKNALGEIELFESTPSNKGMFYKEEALKSYRHLSGNNVEEIRNGKCIESMSAIGRASTSETTWSLPFDCDKQSLGEKMLRNIEAELHPDR